MDKIFEGQVEVTADNHNMETIDGQSDSLKQSAADIAAAAPVPSLVPSSISLDPSVYFLTLASPGAFGGQGSERAETGLLNPLIRSSSQLSVAADAFPLESWPSWMSLLVEPGVLAEVMDSMSPASLGAILDTG
ncbi:hypothetical protein CB1_001722001 [Camelus ferus]|nr:hypothetical protein CB1_001722001 [Camelus ferus]